MNEHLISFLRGARETAYKSVEPLDLLIRQINNKKGQPPLWLRSRVGDLWDYEPSQGEYLAYLKLFCGLQVGDNTLDIGCGCGTMLFPIKNVIGLSGTYYGLDIDKSAISWARRRTKEASFRLLNTADTYLPVATSSIDVVLAKSLFTHLNMFTAAWYLKEVHRVLRNGGYFLTTFFIMTPQRTIHQKGKLLFWPGPPMYPYCLRLTKPDLGVAYDEGWIMDIIHQAGLVVDRLEYGTWADGKGLSFQDIIVLRRMN